MLTLSEQQLKLADEGYRVFFEAFIRHDPQRFIEYDNFVQKHFGNPWLLDEPAVIEYVKGESAAMVWFMGMPLLVDGELVSAAHGADYGSTKEGHGLPAIRALMLGKDCLARQGIDFRFGAPSDHALSVASKLGYRFIGTFSEYALTFETSFSKLSLEERVVFLSHTYDLPLEDVRALAVECTRTAPFTTADYECMNLAHGEIKVERSAAYYRWRVEDLEGRDIEFVRATHEGVCVGFLVLEHRPTLTKIIDWGFFGDEERNVVTLAAMIPHAIGSHTPKFQVNHLNEERSEQVLFERLGFQKRFKKDGQPVINKLCIMPSGKEIDERLLDFSAWQLREIDRDYFMNSNPV